MPHGGQLRRRRVPFTLTILVVWLCVSVCVTVCTELTMMSYTLIHTHTYVYQSLGVCKVITLN